jgi:hypothetical protein
VYERVFTYETASAALEHVQRLTARCRETLEHLWRSIDPHAVDRDLLDAYVRMNRARDEWQSRVREIGAVPRRLWEVEFNTGDGYYFSWRSGEGSIRHARRARATRFPMRIPIPARGIDRAL